MGLLASSVLPGVQVLHHALDGLYSELGPIEDVFTGVFPGAGDSSLKNRRSLTQHKRMNVDDGSLLANDGFPRLFSV